MASLVSITTPALTAPISDLPSVAGLLPLTVTEIDRLYDLVVAFSMAEYKPWIRSLHRFAGFAKETEWLRGEAFAMFELYKKINDPEAILLANRPQDTAVLVSDIAKNTYIILPTGQDAVNHIKNYAHPGPGPRQNDLVPWMQMYVSMMARMSRLDKWSDFEAAIDQNQDGIPEEFADLVEMVKLTAKLHKEAVTLDLPRKCLKRAYKATDCVDSQTLAKLITVVFSTGCGHCSEMGWLKRSAIRASDHTMITRHAEIMDHLKDFTEIARPTSIESFEIAQACDIWAC